MLYGTVQLDELRQIPEKTERDISDLKKKLEKLEKEKAKEDEKLKEVLDSLKTETQVGEVAYCTCKWDAILDRDIMCGTTS